MVAFLPFVFQEKYHQQQLDVHRVFCTNKKHLREKQINHSIFSLQRFFCQIKSSNTSVGAVPETSVPIRFRVLEFEDRFDSGSYLTSRPRFRVGSGRVIGSSICIWDSTIFTIFGGFFGYEYFKVNWSSKKNLLRCSQASRHCESRKKVMGVL